MEGMHPQTALVCDHLGLAKSLAAKFAHGRPSLMDDLYQEACVGLVACARFYNPAKSRFTTYAWASLTRRLLTARRRLLRLPPTDALLDQRPAPERPDRTGDVEELNLALDSLTIPEAEIVLRRHFLPESLKVTAQRFGVSRQRIQQRHAAILGKLRRRLEN
jgi:RNA polymerase sigma factor (sigma-70 family)